MVRSCFSGDFFLVESETCIFSKKEILSKLKREIKSDKILSTPNFRMEPGCSGLGQNESLSSQIDDLSEKVSSQCSTEDNDDTVSSSES